MWVVVPVLLCPQVPHCNGPGSCILISIHYPAGTDNVVDERVVSWVIGNMEIHPIFVILEAHEFN